MLAHSDILQRRFVASRFETLKSYDWELLTYVPAGGSGGGAARPSAAAAPDLGGIYIHQVAATRGAGDRSAALVIGSLSTGRIAEGERPSSSTDVALLQANIPLLDVVQTALRLPGGTDLLVRERPSPQLPSPHLCPLSLM